MHRFVINLLLSFLAVIFSACRHSYTINGTIEGYEGENLYLVINENGEFSVIDSCQVRHKHFQMSGRTDSTVFAVLSHGFEPLMPLFVERGKLRIIISPSVLDARGTKSNNTLYDFLDKKNEIDNRYDDLFQRSHFSSNVLNPYVSYDDSLKLVAAEAEDYIYKFVKKHYDDVVGVCVFLMVCIGDTSDEPSPLIRRIVENAPASFLNNKKIRGYIDDMGF